MNLYKWILNQLFDRLEMWYLPLQADALLARKMTATARFYVVEGLSAKDKDEYQKIMIAETHSFTQL